GCPIYQDNDFEQKKKRGEREAYRKKKGIEIYQEHGFDIPNIINEFIDDIFLKYGQIGVHCEAKGAKKYCIALAYILLGNKKELRRVGIEASQETDYCKKFIEYGMFLRSIYGQKFIPINLRDFVYSLNKKGDLDSKKLSQELTSLSTELGEPVIHGSLETMLPKFDKFIDHTISTQYPKESGNPKLKKAGITMLKEAVQKYNINEGNLDMHLKLALQHIKWGLNKCYQAIQRDQQKTYEETEAREKPVMGLVEALL
ncbi:hypothetical protein HYU07_05815, partial [Candidatus Woesearchaeota archaeon]|nr:hypothetical protein [Candidatus Woesearchaeota archaeon]